MTWQDDKMSLISFFPFFSLSVLSFIRYDLNLLFPRDVTVGCEVQRSRSVSSLKIILHNDLIPNRRWMLKYSSLIMVRIEKNYLFKHSLC